MATSQSVTPPSATCPKRTGAVDPQDPFCRYCGFAILPRPQAALADAYITAKIDQLLTARLASDESLVRGIGDKAEDVVMRRLKYYIILILSGGALLGWLGWHSFSDVTESARRRLDPIVTDAVNKAAQVQRDIQATGQMVERTKTEADGTEKKIDGLSTEVDNQRARVESESGEAARKLAGLQQSMEKADKVANDLAGLDARTHNLETRYTTLSQRVNNQAVAENYPNIDAEPHVVLGSTPISKKDKKPGAIWVQIQVSNFGLQKHIIPGDQPAKLIDDLQAAGITPLLGMPQIWGRVNWGTDRMVLGENASYFSSVIYTDPTKKAIADKLVTIVSKYVTLHQPQPEFARLPPPSTSVVDNFRMIWDLSGIDAQI
jgi:hypothetical protein